MHFSEELIGGIWTAEKRRHRENQNLKKTFESAEQTESAEKKAWGEGFMKGHVG
jgi:hypothetical protein